MAAALMVRLTMVADMAIVRCRGRTAFVPFSKADLATSGLEVQPPFEPESSPDGSRAVQPRRVRAFNDVVISRLLDYPEFVMSAEEPGAVVPWSGSRDSFMSPTLTVRTVSTSG